MHARASASALFFACSLFACGGGEESPPLDEMPLRDTLLAEPRSIAQLPTDVRQRLRARFSAERLRADATTEVSLQPGMTFANQVLLMDATRFSAGRDALLSGTWQELPQTAQATAFIAAVGSQPLAELPPLEGDLSGSTLLMEQHALTGEAGAVVEGLLRATSARRLERVVSLPLAALSANGTVYVNAAWLTAMDPQTTSCSGGGGSNPGGANGAGGPSGATGGSYMYLVGGEAAAAAAEASESGEGEDGQEGVNRASGFGDCSSCNSSLSSCNSACNSTSSACSSSSSSCSSCNDPTGDKACCRACAMTPAAPQSPLVAYGALFWLLLPFGFLALVDRRRARARVPGGMRS
jgi:hypothetical protein